MRLLTCVYALLHYNCGYQDIFAKLGASSFKFFDTVKVCVHVCTEKPMLSYTGHTGYLHQFIDDQCLVKEFVDVLVPKPTIDHIK